MDNNDCMFTQLENTYDWNVSSLCGSYYLLTEIQDIDESTASTYHVLQCFMSKLEFKLLIIC